MTGEAQVIEKNKLPEGFWSIGEPSATSYAQVLASFHRTLKPRNYLEIGVQAGKTLALSTSFSIGVDPAYSLTEPVALNKPACLLFKKTSDAFFRDHNPAALFGQPVEMAFLDGMHWYEFLLRDFINVEKHCRPNSVIFFHDCLPTDAHVARRKQEENTYAKASAHPTWWAGDVWKALAILRKYRKDLKIVGMNAMPTGLVAITNLNPASTVLEDGYYRFVEEFRDDAKLDFKAWLDRDLPMVEAAKMMDASEICLNFWL
jgi:hypothetical protein